MVFPEASEQQAAELGAKFEAWLLARLDAGEVNPGEETWLRMIGSHFRANPDQYSSSDAEFMVEQFAFHPFQQLGGMQQAVRVSDYTAFFLSEDGRPGHVVENGLTHDIFHKPQDERTDDYVHGRFG